MSDTSRINSILDYWIGDAANDPDIAAAKGKLWYQSGPRGDEEIREKFGDDLRLAESGALEDWRETADGSLALVILLDQFSRNLYRGTAAAFSNDATARDVTKHAIERGFKDQLPVVGQLFLLHPFHHAEDLALQDQCISMFEALREQAGESWHQLLDKFLGYAREHRGVIAQFGRFPHRNAALERDSTAEEKQYLDAGASRYGQ